MCLWINISIKIHADQKYTYILRRVVYLYMHILGGRQVIQIVSQFVSGLPTSLTTLTKIN